MIAIIAAYWVTEALPLAVTALLPLVLFPAIGVLSAKETAINYLNDTTMLFIGGLMVAVAIEKWNLHKRMALLVLMVVGSRPTWQVIIYMYYSHIPRLPFQLSVTCSTAFPYCKRRKAAWKGGLGTCTIQSGNSVYIYW